MLIFKDALEVWRDRPHCALIVGVDISKRTATALLRHGKAYSDPRAPGRPCLFSIKEVR